MVNQLVQRLTNLDFKQLINLKKKLKVAVVFEGRDAAGKGSAIKRIVEHLMTAHFRVVELGTPTKKQNNSWFYTYEKTLPKKGEIVFYDSVDLRKYKNLFEKAERILGWRPHTDMESLVKKVTLEIE